MKAAVLAAALLVCGSAGADVVPEREEDRLHDQERKRPRRHALDRTKPLARSWHGTPAVAERKMCRGLLGEGAGGLGTKTGKGRIVSHVEGGFRLVPPAWSPDGRLLYFTST